jgi:hypothetical protein
MLADQLSIPAKWKIFLEKVLSLAIKNRAQKYI